MGGPGCASPQIPHDLLLPVHQHRKGVHTTLHPLDMFVTAVLCICCYRWLRCTVQAAPCGVRCPLLLLLLLATASCCCFCCCGWLSSARMRERTLSTAKTDLDPTLHPLRCTLVRHQMQCAGGAHCASALLVFPGGLNDPRVPAWQCLRYLSRLRHCMDQDAAQHGGVTVVAVVDDDAGCVLPTPLSRADLGT